MKDTGMRGGGGGKEAMIDRWREGMDGIEGRQVTHHHFVDVRFTAYNRNPDNNTEPRHKAAALARGLGMPSVVCIFLVVCM